MSKPLFDESISRHVSDVVASIWLVQRAGFNSYVTHEKTSQLVLDLIRPIYERLEFLRKCGITVESEETADGERFFIRNVSAKTRTYLEELWMIKPNALLKELADAISCVGEAVCKTTEAIATLIEHGVDMSLDEEEKEGEDLEQEEADDGFVPQPPNW